MQLKYLNIFILCVFFVCCKKQKKIEVQYYPSKHNYQESKIVELGLDTTNLNFLKITGRVRQIYEKNRLPLIEILDNGTKKRIIPLMISEKRKRDILSLTLDSILIDEGYSIDKLKPILRRHYLNNGKHYNYPRSFKKALIEITIDTSKNGKDLKRSLLNLTRVFDEVNSEIKDTLELKVFFNCFRQIPPPPKPKIEN